MIIVYIVLSLIGAAGVYWLLQRTKKTNKPKPVKVKTVVQSTSSNEEKVIEVTPEEYKKKNGGIPAGMPMSFAVCDDDD